MAGGRHTTVGAPRPRQEAIHSMLIPPLWRRQIGNRRSVSDVTRDDRRRGRGVTAGRPDEVETTTLLCFLVPSICDFLYFESLDEAFWPL